MTYKKTKLFALLIFYFFILSSCGEGLRTGGGSTVGVSDITGEVNGNGTMTVTIKGSGFQSGVTVTINGTACTGVQVVSETVLTCLLPNASIPLINVVLSTPGGSSSGGYTPVIPTSYRYFKFVITQTQNGTACAGTSYIKFFRFKWSNTLQNNAMTSDSSGTIGGYSVKLTPSSETNVGGGVGQVWDAMSANAPLFGNYWATAGGIFPGNPGVGTASFTADFGAGNLIAMNGYELEGGSLCAGSSPTAFYLQASNDNATWTTICGVQTGQNVVSSIVLYSCN